MDYLPSVTVEPAHITIAVPYLGNNDDHLASFYPQLQHGETIKLSFTMDTAIADMAALLQMKYYFGLIRDLAHTDFRTGKYRSENRTNEGETWLSATSLPTMVQAWRSRQSCNDSSTATSITTEIHPCKIKEHIQLVAETHSKRMVHFMHNMHRDSLTPVILSIQALLETIWDAYFAPDSSRRYQDMRSKSPMWFQNALVHHLLVKAGWQPSEIELMPKDIRYRYYLSYFRQRSARALRRASSALRVTEKERYFARHVQGTCHCTSLSTILPKTCRTGNSFHLVTLPEDQINLQLQTHESPSTGRGTIRFVAFSHVRSDGLGSSTANSLPVCQIVRLQQLSNDLLPDDDRPVPFYIDTLCVPLAGKSKRTALRNLRAVFENAEKVLVLDSDLCRTRSGLPQEDLTRMRISVWMKRLWTVQECAVSTDVYFRFRDRQLSLNKLLESYDNGHEFPLLRNQSMKDRNLPMLPESDLDQLHQALALLSDDLQLGESIAHDATTDRERAQIRALRKNYDKWKLRRILRIGHLALPQMRYFSEPNESTEFQTVVSTILKEYTSLILSPFGQRIQRGHIDPEVLFARLKNIQHIKFTSDRESVLSPPNIMGRSFIDKR